MEKALYPNLDKGLLFFSIQRFFDSLTLAQNDKMEFL